MTGTGISRGGDTHGGIAALTLFCAVSLATAVAQSWSLASVATLNVPAQLVELDGDRAYVAAGETFRVIDLSDPTTPVELASWTAPGRIWSLHVDGSHVYLAGGLEGLHILDVSSPRAPALRATHPTAGQALGVTTSGRTALVVNLMTGLEVVDISDQTTPHLLSTIETQGYQWGIGGGGSRVYVVDQPSGLHLFDTTDPTKPTPMGVHVSAEPGQAVEIGDGARAYVLAPRAGLVEIVDVADPAAPQVLGTYEPRGPFGRQLATSGLSLIVPVGEAGLEIVDVSEAAEPKLVATYDTPGNAQDVDAEGDLIAVADGEALLILRR